MKIGVFDSGVGGLSVLKALLDVRLFDEIIYYGDTARVPYGVKDRDTIVRFSLEALGFFAPFGIDMLIIACNTASAYALKALRASANFPVLGVIDAGVLAVQRALSDSNAQILVIGTKATIKSQQYQKRLFKAGFKRVQALATGLFVPMVEEGIFEGALVQAAFEHYFKPLNFGENVNFGGNLSENSRNLNGCGLNGDFGVAENSQILNADLNGDLSAAARNLRDLNGVLNGNLNAVKNSRDFNAKNSHAPDALILGCTHFPLLSKALQGYFGDKTRLIHSGDAIVSQLQSEFNLRPKRHKSKVHFHATSDIKALKNTAKLWLSGV